MRDPNCGPEAKVVRIFRAWRAAMESGQSILPHVTRRAETLGIGAIAGLACASLFELVEAQLGRPLQAAPCCSSRLSADERALVGLLRWAEGAGPFYGTEAIPHGLPGAIRWAAVTVRCEFGFIRTDPQPERGAHTAAQCPFARIDQRGGQNAHAA